MRRRSLARETGELRHLLGPARPHEGGAQLGRCEGLGPVRVARRATQRGDQTDKQQRARAHLKLHHQYHKRLHQ